MYVVFVSQASKSISSRISVPLVLPRTLNSNWFLVKFSVSPDVGRRAHCSMPKSTTVCMLNFGHVFTTVCMLNLGHGFADTVKDLEFDERLSVLSNLFCD